MSHQFPDSKPPTLIEMNRQEEAEAVSEPFVSTLSTLDAFLPTISKHVPKPRDELDDISAKLLDDGKEFADKNERKIIKKTFQTLECKEPLKERLREHYSEKVYVYQCKKDSTSHLLLWGNRQTFGSFMPTFALEDVIEALVDTVCMETLVPLPEEVKNNTPRQVLEAHAKLFAKTYAVNKDLVIHVHQTLNPTSAKTLWGKFNALSTTKNRKCWNGIEHLGADDSLYWKSDKTAEVSSDVQTSKPEAALSILERQNNHHLDVICAQALQKMWIDSVDVLDCAKIVVRYMFCLIGKDNVLPLLKSPDPTYKLVWVSRSNEETYPKTLFDFMLSCVALQSHELDAHVREWLRECLELSKDKDVSIPCINIDVAFRVYAMVVECPVKGDPHAIEVESFVKFLSARLRAFELV